MSDGIWSALSGAVAQQRSLDVVANNVANVNTTGFRADRVAFREALSQAQSDGPAPESIRFVGVANVEWDESGGTLKETGSPYDVAIDGDGWFVLQTPQGERYTRAGSFLPGQDGVLRSREGFPVLGAAQPGNTEPRPIVVPADATEVRIAGDGTIVADGDSVGRLRVVRFEDRTALQKEGATLFTSNAAPSDALDTTSVRQGMLEQANVNVIAGMNELITVTRSFEAFQKVIETFRELDQRTARELGARR